jgi:hypothetical protein
MRALPGPSEWLRGILWIDEEPPNTEQQGQLLAFVRKGGQVITAKYWGPQGVTRSQEDWLYGYDIYSLPKGRIVVAEGGFPSPYQLARDAHLLVSRKNDFVRLYNPGTTKYYSSIDRERRRQVVQVVNYSTEIANYVTLWLDSRARSARLWRPKPQSSPPVRGIPATSGTNFDLPSLPVNCAVEVERSV